MAMKHAWWSWAVGGALVCSSSWWTNEARAAESCGGRICPPLFECTTQVSTCAPEDVECVPLVDTWCRSPDCAAGAACPDGMRCSLASGTCTPNYELPCNTSTDCGAGFRCEPLATCDCPPGEEPSSPACACDGLEEKYCAFDITACTPETASTDCAPSFSCAENSEGLCNNPGDPHTGCNPGDPPFVCTPRFLVGTTTTADLGGERPPPQAHEPDTQGCSAGARPAPASSAALFFALALAAGVRRRSARSRVSSRR